MPSSRSPQRFLLRDGSLPVGYRGVEVVPQARMLGGESDEIGVLPAGRQRRFDFGKARLLRLNHALRLLYGIPRTDAGLAQFVGAHSTGRTGYGSDRNRFGGLRLRAGDFRGDRFRLFLGIAPGGVVPLRKDGFALAGQILGGIIVGLFVLVLIIVLALVL